MHNFVRSGIVNSNHCFVTHILELRELTIHGGFERDSGFTTGREGGRDKIGDITFTHAFSKMGSLQYLHITVENDVSRDTELDYLARFLFSFLYFV